MKDDIYFLKKAIEAGNKMPAPYNFGGLVVIGGEIISAECSSVQATNDPSAHSEVNALKVAAQKLGNWHMDGATLYASHEPCVMCLSCAAWSHVDRIVFATPKSAQKDFIYEFKDIDIFELAKQLLRPMKVEQLSLDTDAHNTGEL